MKALQTFLFEGLFEWQKATLKGFSHSKKAACTFYFKRDYNIAN